METINIHQAESDLSQLLLRVERGEEIIISDQGIPIAKLVPFQATFDAIVWGKTEDVSSSQKILMTHCPKIFWQHLRAYRETLAIDREI
jgi:prevent-host-death family protein